MSELYRCGGARSNDDWLIRESIIIEVNEYFVKAKHAHRVETSGEW